MARYFKYKSAADVSADAARLGHSLTVSDDFSSLFHPVNIGPHQAGNRLCVQPMEGCDGTREGHPDELTYRRYVRFGDGGAKILWGEATAIREEVRMNPRQLWIHEGSLASLSRMIDGCRAAHRAAYGSADDLVIGLQLTHSGRYSYRRPLLATHDPILDPLTLDKSTGKRLDASYPVLSDDELKRVEDDFLEAARLAAKLDIQFVDIKQCHRYLLSELLASRNREGEYGGSLENRTRLVRNVVGRVRNELPKLTVATRMNAYDGIPYRGAGEDFVGEPCPHELPIQVAFGTNPENHLQMAVEEPRQVARWLADAGVSLFNISAGNPYANPHLVRPAEFPPTDGYHTPEHPLLGVLRHLKLAEEIQAAVPEVPVVGSGYSWLQDFAPQVGAAQVSSRKVTIMGMGRATLSQPDFVRQLQEHGRLDRKRVCRTFSYCTNLMRSKDHPLGQYATGCPPFDKEAYGEIWKEAEEKLNRARDGKGG